MTAQNSSNSKDLEGDSRDENVNYDERETELPVMSDTPHTDGDTDDADNHQWYEDQDPLK